MLGSLLSYFAAGSCIEKKFIGIPTWYHYLLNVKPPLMAPNKDTGRCEFVGTLTPENIKHLSLIALALVDIALRVAALVAVAYVIYGGVQFVTAQGDAALIKKARQTIINALIGLVIALISTGLVSFIGTKIG